ncbi:MAG: polysaccharide deacetylase family protein [Xanthomonadales bacterium]|nr:polysaccharide deacetylase family protein [Xanthomonadales bacterium]
MNPRPRKIKLLRWLPRRLMLTTGPAKDNGLYLSFDDGPHPGHTEAILDLLAANDARASFFVLGEQAERHPELMRRIAAEGHLLGNHSYDHPSFPRIPIAEQMSQIERTDQLIAAFDGRQRHLFRPPSGRFSIGLLLRFAFERRRMAYWSYDSLDYRRVPAERLVETMRRHPPAAGDIVLMHDDNEATTQALAMLLPEWRAAGFSLRILPV